MSEPPVEETAAEASAKRARRMLLLAVLAVVALVPLVVIVVAVVRPAVKRQQAIDTSALDTRGFERVAWASGGRYAIIQDFDRDGTPILSAWDRETGATKSERGYLLLRLETDAAAVWVEPMTSVNVRSLLASSSAPYPLTGAEWYDEPGPKLKRWDVSQPGGPVAAINWAAEPNGKGVTAELTVDSSAGSGPSVLRLRQPDGRVVVTQRASRYRTLQPLGWSATGEYFAAVVLESAPPSASDPPDRNMLVYRPDGTYVETPIVSRATLGLCWSGAGNSLVYDISLASRPPRPVLADDLDVRVTVGQPLLSAPSPESTQTVLGPAGSWVLVHSIAKRGADQYDEVVAPRQRRLVMLLPADRTLKWRDEAWHEGSGLLRLGISVSPTGQVQTRVLLYRPGVSRPKTVYKGPKRLAAGGNQ